VNMVDNENDSDMTTNAKGIEVFLRIRPSPVPSGYISQDDIDENQLIFKIPQEDRGIVNNSRTHYSFNFNGILDQNTNQDHVFRTIGVPAVNNVLQGYNSTVFAYGQTGSGKTFTMTGGPERYADRGIIPRAISLLFSKLQEDSSKGVSYSCFISYLELYNESGFDLLAAVDDVARNRFENMPRVTMLEDEEGNYHFRNLSVNVVSSEEDALNFLFIGDTNRAIGETEMNQSSSRSHCIFSIMIEKRVAGLDTVIRSKLNLVDLAGSERVGKTSSAGQTLKEAQYINSSLFFLEMVIVALNERTKRGKENTHIPYRNYMMTSVLRDSLGGNCLTMMIATISPEAKQTDESISTCHFATRVALVKNVAYINEDLEPELVIRRLKAEIKRLREEVRFLKSERGEDDMLQDGQIEELKQSVTAFIDSSDEGELDMGSLTLTKIQSVFRIFKSMIRGDDDKMVLSHEDTSHQKNVDYENEIQSLKFALAQRDEEVKFLTNVIQKNQAYDITKIAQLVNSGSTTGDESETVINQSVSKLRQIIPLQVNGVDRCLDHSILTDPSKAFAWFRERYPGVQSLNENKALLQEKFQEVSNGLLLVLLL
jgi:kinesin family member 6/9